MNVEQAAQLRSQYLQAVDKAWEVYEGEKAMARRDRDRALDLASREYQIALEELQGEMNR